MTLKGLSKLGDNPLYQGRCSASVGGLSGVDWVDPLFLAIQAPSL